MLKKLSIAGLALLASSGIAFADTSDSMPAADTNTVSDTSSSTATDASMENSAADNTAAASTSTPTKAVAHKKHKKHKKHHHKKHHHHKPVAAAESDPVAASAPVGDYKGEVSPCAPAVCPHYSISNGFYAGASVGSRVNYTTSRSIGIAGTSYNAGATNFTGADGTLFGGYGMYWDQWYGALEILAQDTLQISSNTNAYGNSKSSWGFGVSVLPGYLITDNVLGFLRLGYIGTKFNTGSKYVSGGQVGLGLNTALCSNWDLRGEWDANFYGNNSTALGNVKSQAFNLGLIYKFEG